LKPSNGTENGITDPQWQFLLAEYNSLWQANWRSQESSEGAVRTFLLVVGGLASAAAVLSAFAKNSTDIGSTAAVQAVGAVALIVALVGIPTSLYVANEQGYRVKNLRHLNDLRKMMSGYLRLPHSPGDWLKFEPGPFSGRTASYVIVELLTCFSLLVGVYLLANASGVATALKGSGSLPVNFRTAPAIVLPCCLFAVQTQAVKEIARIWERRYKRDAQAMANDVECERTDTKAEPHGQQPQPSDARENEF